uniref:J domain-containing protein n=1 Tax=Clastoptera arizonana TaxID=38151 RepID=A0A1B6CP18_9HEMI
MNYNYYQIFGCDETASIEEIKTKYRELILKFHPDKCSNKEENTEYIEALNEAWGVLRDENKRKVYDAQLKLELMGKIPIIFDKISLNELRHNQSDNLYLYNCRCGGEYILQEQEISFLNNLDYNIECDSCSLVLKVYLT